jgi:hypothetical protein
MKTKFIMAAAVLGSSLVLAAAPALARGGHHYRGGHHGYYHGGFGAGIAGFAAGALLGGALAAQPDYYYGAPDYDYAPGYYGDDAEAYCAQRFRSYDPESGTYLGYDGRRHSCP